MTINDSKKLWKEMLIKHEELIINRIHSKIPDNKKITDPEEGELVEKTFYLNDLPASTFTLDIVNSTSEIFSKIIAKYLASKYTRAEVLGILGDLEEIDGLNGFTGFEGEKFTKFSLLVKYRMIEK